MMKQYKLSSTARAAMTLAQAARRATAALAIILLTAMTAGAQEAITGLTYNSTGGGYYEINDEQDLVDLATYVNGGNNASGKTFKQTQDIDMGSIGNFEPIGSKPMSYNPTQFSGTYDGQGYAIIGLTVNTSSPYAGLFGQLYGGSVRNLTMVNPNVTSNDNSSGDKYAGGIVGVMSPGTIENCYVINPTIKTSSGNGKKGAICGGINAKDCAITDCYYYTTTNYDAVGLNQIGVAYSASRTYALTLNDGITTSTVPAFSYGGTGYYVSGTTITLPAAPIGWVYTYTVNDSPIDGNTFDISGNATVSRTAAHISPLLGYDDDPLVDGSAEHPYTIKTTEGWNLFCDMQEGGETFSGKTIVLAGDIGTPEDPVTRMGSSTTQFRGTFDGQGHTLTVQYGTPSEPVNQQFVAPFPNVTGGATFSNLTIAGSIYNGYDTSGDKGTGGLIGCLFGNVTVEHCVSTVTVNAASDHAGGFVGLCEHAVTFTDCVSSAIVTCTGSGSGFVGWSRASDKNYTIAFYGCLFSGKVLKQGNVGSGNGSFVGWKGFSKTVTITNCIAAPAADENMATDNSATFCRYSADTSKDNGETHITNCYYTQTLGAAQGMARHTVTAGTDVTVAHAGVATHYATSGITAYKATGASTDSDLFIAGLLYNNNVVDVLYAGSGDVVSLTLSNSATGAPLGYQYGYTASAGTLSGSTLTMPDANVTVNVDTETLRSDGQQHVVSYMTADGTTRTYVAIALDGHEAVGEDDFVHLAAGTYYVGTDITYANEIRPTGNITLILADGKTMTLNGNMWGINGGSNLTIYGQSLDAATAGTLRYDGTSYGIYMYKYEQHSGNVSITTAGFLVKGIVADVTLLRGGTLTISADGNDACAIYGNTHSILGGQLTATATGTNAIGIYASAPGGTAITLGWTRPADRITASSISTSRGTVAVADGKALIDGSGHIYTGTLDASVLSGFDAKTTLQPALQLADNANNATQIATLNGIETAAILAGRTLYKDGSWNTLCLPFSVSTASGTLSGDGVKAMTLNTATSSLADGTLTLNFDAATGQTIPAGTPFIIKWDNTGVNIENPVFEGVTVSNATNDATVTDVLTFTGTYAPVIIAGGGDNTKLYLGAANKLYYPNAAMTIGTHRAYFQLAEGITAGEPASHVRAFALNFGDDEATGIISVHDSGFMVNGSDAWYTLDGRRLDGQPTAKGLYIHGGKKVAIK